MHPLARSIRRYISLKAVVIVFTVVSLVTFSGVGVYGNLISEEEETNDDSGGRPKRPAIARVFEEFKKKKSSRSKDYLKESADEKNNEIYLRRATPIILKYDGEKKRITTFQKSVDKLLEEKEIVLNEKDKLIGLGLNDDLKDDALIEIIRVNEIEKNIEEVLPYKVIRKENKNMAFGEESVLQEGKNGLISKKILERYENGMLSNKVVMEENVITEPLDKVIEFGTKKITSRGKSIDFKNCIKMKATGYTASYVDTGKRPGDPGFGITSSGMKAQKGVVAVDPRVIPLGTKLYIEGIGGATDYGYATAGDTGGAIKGNKIDLYFDSRYMALCWGVRNVNVYILN